MGSIKVLNVTSNADSGAGSLREALKTTQENPGDYEIVFSDPPKQESQVQSQSDSYWTIKLNKPLPHIEKGSIYINYSRTKSVILVPADSSNTFGSNNGSMLTVGSSKRSDAKVKIKSVNFIRNHAEGQGGVHGGGGGLGAGSGLIIAGDVKVLLEDLVFQDLEVAGGKGSGEGPYGQHTGDWVINKIGREAAQQPHQRSQSGKGGGISSPALREIIGSTPGGRPGEHQLGRYNDVKDIISGKDAGAEALFGEGGAPGGAGKSGYTYYTTSSGYKMLTNSGWGGNGGSGSKGGFGAGGGAGGGIGATHKSAGSNTSAKAGSGAQGGKYATDGTDAEDLKRFEYGTPGGIGGNGAALGGAIAIFDSLIADLKGEGPQVELKNTRFVGSQASAGPWNTRIWDPEWHPVAQQTTIETEAAESVNILYSDSDNPIIIDSVTFSGAAGANLLDLKANPGDLKEYNDKDFSFKAAASNYLPEKKRLSRLNIFEMKPEDSLPFFEATSRPYEASYAQLVDPQIYNTPGVNDTNIIRYEDAFGGSISVMADFSSPNSAFRPIWKELIPDKEKEIRANYERQTAISQTLFGIGKDVASQVGKQLGKLAFNANPGAGLALLAAKMSLLLSTAI